MEKSLRIIGRVLLALIFVMSSLNKLFHFHDMVGLVASKGIPAPSFLLAGAITLELLGGLSVLTGFKVRWGVTALIVFLIPVTLIFHNFWAYQGMEQQMQMANFLKNVSIAGGLLALASYSKD
jgi:putative oxidoreductase